MITVATKEVSQKNDPNVGYLFGNKYFRFRILFYLLHAHPIKRQVSFY